MMPMRLEEKYCHFKNYKKKIIENNDSNLVIRSVEVSDQVLIKKDFNMNPKREECLSSLFTRVHPLLSLDCFQITWYT